jgi:tetratricopeptide (TPR) repeat protein
MLWYQFGPFEAYYETGRHQELIVLADSTIKSAGGNVEEIYYWKGWGLISQGDIEGARQVWQQAVELNPNYKAAAAALETIDVSDPEGGQAAPAANAGG